MKTPIVSLLLLSTCYDLSTTLNFPDPLTPAAIFQGNLQLEEGTSDKSFSFSGEREDRGVFFCPDQCVCSVEERIIDCSSQGLERVPQVPSGTTRL